MDIAPKVTVVLQLKDMVQKNKKTGFERRLRLAIKDPKDGGEMLTFLALQIKLKIAVKILDGWNFALRIAYI